ncbi:MAG: DUF3619 family protein [Betaproteobacteria bacterium]
MFADDGGRAEQNFGARVVAAMGGGNPGLSVHIERRLSAARWQAVEAAQRVRRLKAMDARPAVISYGSAAGLTPWWARLAAFTPAVALTLGLICIDQFNLTQRIEAAAEVDAALLSDDLPPSAYADPGFAEFLKSPRP